MERLNALPPYLPCPGPHYYPWYVYPTWNGQYVPPPSWTWTVSSSDMSSSSSSIGSGSVVNG